MNKENKNKFERIKLTRTFSTLFVKSFISNSSLYFFDIFILSSMSDIQLCTVGPIFAGALYVPLLSDQDHINAVEKIEQRAIQCHKKNPAKE